MELLAPEVIVFCGYYDGVAEKRFQLDEEEKRWNKKLVQTEWTGKAVTLCYVYHPTYSKFKQSLENI
jgi:hypothetical protein